MRCRMFVAGAGILLTMLAGTSAGADWNIDATTQSSTTATTSTRPASATAPATQTMPTTSKPAMKNAARDFSSAEWTVRTFAEALRLSDADTLEACFMKPAEEDAITSTGMQLLYSSVRLRRAAEEQFGADAGGQFEVTTLTISLETARLAALGGRVRKLGNGAVLKVSDEITMQINPDPATSEWKVDPVSFVPVKLDTKAQIQKQLLLMNAAIDGINETIAELKQGKQTNVTQAASAYRIRMSALARKAKAAATQPATRGAEK